MHPTRSDSLGVRIVADAQLASRLADSMHLTLARVIRANKDQSQTI